MLASYLAFGVGQGVVNAPITNTAVSGMPRSHAGVAAAVATTSRNIGTSLGVAIVGSILSSHISGMIAADFIAASRPALWVIVGFGLTVFVVGARHNHGHGATHHASGLRICFPRVSQRVPWAATSAMPAAARAGSRYTPPGTSGVSASSRS